MTDQFTEIGPKTEGRITRYGCFIDVRWIKRGKTFNRRVYEPFGLKITPALADVLVLALEGGDEPFLPRAAPFREVKAKGQLGDHEEEAMQVYSEPY